MNQLFSRFAFAFAVICLTIPLLHAGDAKQKAKAPQDNEFRTLDKAIIAKSVGSATIPSQEKPSKNAYLGIQLRKKTAGDLIVAHVAPESAAAQAGLREGDKFLKVNGKAVKDEQSLADWIRKQKTGIEVKFAIQRGDKPMELTAKLTSASKPFTPRAFRRRRGGSQPPAKNVGGRPILGVRIEDAPKDSGILITALTPGFPAQKAGIKVGDILQKIDGKVTKRASDLRTVLSGKKPNDVVLVAVKRKDKDMELKVKLAGYSQQRRTIPRKFGRGRGGRKRYWDKPVYRLAVVQVEFDDVQHNKKIAAKDWENALFSKRTYNKKSVTGQTVYGSLNDYYLEQSYGKFRVEGKVFDYVKLSKKRDAYKDRSKRRAFFSEALDMLIERDGKDALAKFDGLFFLYAGSRARVKKGELYWPHKSNTSHGRKRWSYFICPEGGTRMSTISVIAHEFGHLLGLPDLYPRQGVDPEGSGIWCTMSVGHGRSGRPLHFSAWSKEKLGWLKPVVIDPNVPQKLILRPVQHASTESCKILLKKDASEYLLLENRTAKGFDVRIPGQGMLIWHVVNNRPHLLESHGIVDPSGPRQFLKSVPYPSDANNALTPYTVPSSRPRTGNGVPVFISNINRRADGAVTFYIGYEFF